MSRDVRELILARLVVIMEGVDGILAAYRDRADLDEDMLPAAYVLDGKEQKVSAPGRTIREPMLMRLQPQIFLKLKPNRPANKDMGPVLSGFRNKILLAIAGDELLSDLVGEGTGGVIEYVQSDTDMQSGSTMEGQESVDLAITYILDINDLS